MKRLAEGIYGRDRQGPFYERVHQGGLNTLRKLPAHTLREAISLRRQNMVARQTHLTGLAENPDAGSVHTVVEILRDYMAEGAPGRNRQRPVRASLETMRENVFRLSEWRDWPPPAQIRMPTLEAYDVWRRSTSKRLRNGRSVDKEISTLKLALRWAARWGWLERNPLDGLVIGRYQRGPSVNCREHRPVDADELHLLAARLFTWPTSQVLGWQLLFEAFTGVRTNEALRCRWDARYGEAGYRDQQFLHLQRSKKGVNPWCALHPALTELLAEMRRWGQARYPHSPWFFPSPRAEGPVSATALVHALQRLGPPHRTSHGLRAFYVTVRRSEGISDGQIAAEIGDRTGPTLIASTDGDVPPNWQDSKEAHLTWLPSKGLPAWTIFSGSDPLGAHGIELSVYHGCTQAPRHPIKALQVVHQ